MKKKISFIFFIAIVMFSFSINNTQASTGTPSQSESKTVNKIQIKKLFNKKSKDVWENNNLIAHAFGAVDGKDYTNSFEAFEQNYKKGYRVFEVDFLLTSDNRLIARHDWSYDRALLFKQNPPHNLGTPWDYESVMNQKIYDAYSPVDVALVIEIMEKHPDVYIVTDSPK
ncbi:glycerophosphodiester phosphodiesterase family protein [Lysinibacillus fusiformis]|uniref:glycerophosphodiester phosphodiesterase family protein n=1 Tax=Lysinibacillus fusiformis TaxID=28031 RepID=UPI003D05CEAF